MAPFTMMDIKLLCGVTAFKRGQEYQQSGRIGKLAVSEDGRHYTAVVRGTESYEVTVDLDDEGEIEAHCNCPSYGNYYDYCKHIAAVLLAIHERVDIPGPSGTNGMTSKVGTLVEEQTWERPYSTLTSTSSFPVSSLPSSPTSSTHLSPTADESEKINAESTNSSYASMTHSSSARGSQPQHQEQLQQSQNPEQLEDLQPPGQPEQKQPDESQQPKQRNPEPSPFAQAGRPSSASGWGRSADKPSYRTADQILSMFAKDRRLSHEREQQYTAPARRSILREELQVQFICKLVHVHKGGAKLALELKVGNKRLYVVQKVKQFLNCVEKGEPMSFTKLFHYDPLLHVFRAQDQAILSMLIRMRQSEEAYRESISGYLGASDGRDILIAPIVWKPLLELLLQADSRMEGTGLANGPLTLSEGALPLFYRIAEGANEGYQLEVSGLRELILLPAYDAAVVEGQLYMLEPMQMRSLEDLNSALTSYGIKESIDISSQQVDEFVQHVVPELRTLGHLSIDSRVREQIAEPELSPKLYIDFYRERITARLEFDYGVMVINPLAEYLINEEEKKVILIRDRFKEQNLIERLDRSFLEREGSVWASEREDAIYDVLYHLLPELEKLADIYMPNAVKAMMPTYPVPPKVRADLGRGLDWLEISFEMEGVDEQELQELMRSIVEKKAFFRLRSGVFLSLEHEGASSFARMADALGLEAKDIHSSHIRLPAVRALQLPGRDEVSGHVKWGGSLKRFLDDLRDPDRMDFPLPQTLGPVLRDYQASGYQWLRTLAHYRFGGILADDMGLGKTLQSIAYITASLQEKPIYEPDQVRAGADQMLFGSSDAETDSKNWNSLFMDEHTQSNAAHTSGNPDDGWHTSHQEGLTIRTRMTHPPVLVVAPASLTYNWASEFARFAPHLNVFIVAGQKDERASMLADMDKADVIVTSYPLLRRDLDTYLGRTFHTLILDEAQAIKNASSQTAQAVKQIQAPRRFALTGTPVENSLDELWSIFEAVFPGLFPSYRRFRDLPAERISRMVRPFILRRLKKDVLEELPDRIETVQRSELTVEQKKLYAAYLSQLQDETSKDMEDNGFQKNRIKILAGITRLRQLCCHPALFVDGYQGDSGKMEQLLQTVQDCLAAGKRILIFSQFASMLGLIRQTLAAQGNNLFYLDGQTPAQSRVDMCRRFNEGEAELFLISLKAGGTGLNLTGADTVILYDLWWNPAVEEQAIGRAHRMGQKQVVQVIRLVTEGTIEEKILELQQRKKDLIAEVIEPGDGGSTTLSEQDIRELLMV
ncbi:RNA polymerase-associated protein RapA [Paenibacillus sp. JJ-100]|uniref:DEAD/DEAH box helicase n=1 Tax=Paenibacillus sp. JJ-100 TaxID=2974896 RepID=UPI0022FFB730|nr:SNF2 helicase associated domain-containing protein [Paenibacillus sp. JJ-100]CAI6086411.1 RNA polymerase-associated protein RapA [Paenibacillus sp. JJ-100]